jgi:hypothetical protein
VNKEDVKPGFYAEFPIAWLRADAGTQARLKLDPKTVKDYANAMSRGDKFPPADIFWDGHDGYIGDGHHRHEGTRLASLTSMPVLVWLGGRREATLHSCGANAGHGRSEDDRRNAIAKLLLDEEWVKWSDRKIASHCKVSPTIVGQVRKQLSTRGQLKDVTHRKSKDGKTRNVAAAAAATQARGEQRRATKGGAKEPARSEPGKPDRELATPPVDGTSADELNPPITIDRTVPEEVSSARMAPPPAPPQEDKESLTESALETGAAVTTPGTAGDATASDDEAKEVPGEPAPASSAKKQLVAARTRRLRSANQTVLGNLNQVLSLMEGRTTLQMPFAKIRELVELSVTALKEVEP